MVKYKLPRTMSDLESQKSQKDDLKIELLPAIAYSFYLAFLRAIFGDVINILCAMMLSKSMSRKLNVSLSISELTNCPQLDLFGLPNQILHQ